MSRVRLDILAPMKSWGGIEGKIATLSKEFVARGVDVQLLLPRGGKIPYPERLPQEISIRDLATRGKLGTVARLMEHFRSDPPDALLAAKDHAVKSAVLARGLSRAHVPIFVKLTNTQSEVLRRRWKRQVAKWVYPWADGVIAISEGVREDYIAHFSTPPERVTVIYNPAVTPDFARRLRESPSHPWLASETLPVVLAAGRLTQQKGFDTLLEAFAMLRKQKEARLLILGEGPLRNELIRRAEELGVGPYVDLPGYVPNPLAWMARASLFVLSSRYEGLGNVLIEALAAGAPVVSTDCPSGPREILEEGRLGPLVPPEDTKALAQAMTETLGRAPEKEVVERSLDRFRSGPVADRYLEFMGLA